MTETTSLRIGIIGLGSFGSRVAMRLLWNGFPSVNTYDQNDMTVRLFSNEYGAMGLGSPRMVAQTSDIVITILPSAADLQEACFGWESLAKGFPNGGTIIDLGVTDPRETSRIAAELAARKIDFIDAPAFGSPTQAKEGKLTLVVGGEEAAVVKVQPILQILSQRIFRAGGPGTAQAASALADYMSSIQILAASEAIRLGVQFGFKPNDLLDICDAMGGHAVPGLIRSELATRRFESGRPLGLVRRNLALVMQMANQAQVQAPLLQTNLALWDGAEQQIGYGSDQTAIIKWLETLQPPLADSEEAPQGEAEA